MGGLKNVRQRRDDALSRVKWDRLESLLADYYRKQGFDVDHCGTGGGRRRYDGGIDLKLRRGSQFLIVQCKGWNAYQVPHNDVHELLGVMVTEGATGAIFVTSGEYTDAARRKAANVSSLTLVDGDELRRMLGPVLDQEAPQANPVESDHDARWQRGYQPPPSGTAYEGAGDSARRHRQTVADVSKADRAPAELLVKLAVGAILFVVFGAYLRAALQRVISGQDAVRAQPASVPARSPPQRDFVHTQMQTPTTRVTAAASSVASSVENVAVAAPKPLTPKERRTQRRESDEAIKILERTTPEFVPLPYSNLREGDSSEPSEQP